MRNASGQQSENERQYKEEKKKKGEQLTQAAIFFVSTYNAFSP